MNQEKSLFAAHALLPGGWVQNVLLRWDAQGRFTSVQADAEAPQGTTRAAGPVLPGMPNLHSHAFQRGFAGLSEFRGQAQDSFWSWRNLMYRFAARLSPQHLEAIATWLYIEMLEAGYTSVCEFHYLHHQPDGQPYAPDSELSLALLRAAKTAGIGMVVVRNSSHYGIAGYYPLMAEREGLAAFSMTNTGPIMVPTFGREMMLGTNPMAFCMPADPYPFWFDASTTVVTLGKVEVYNKRGKPMPEGWTIDGAGQPCSDAHRMNESILSGGMGGILPLGGEGERTSGHKGYGLAIMVEALTGVLAQGMLSPEMCGAHGDHTSHFFMAFDPAMFGDPADIRARMSGYLQALRESEKAPGYPRIYTPGENAHVR